MIMKIRRKRLLGLLALLFIFSAAVVLKYEPAPKNQQVELSISEQKIPIEDIILESFASGTTSTLASHLSEEVSLSILDEEDFLTSSETLSRLQLFFEQHPPENMVKKHSGISKGGQGQYLIGILSTTGGEEYRCYFFMESRKISSIEIRLEEKQGLKDVI